MSLIHFANWKTNLQIFVVRLIFQIDADEIPNKILIEIYEILEQNDNVDVVLVPREMVEGLTDKHIQKWMECR